MAKTLRGRCTPLPAKSKGVQRRKYKRFTKGTYIGLIASIIQDSPNKMLTFKNIMVKLAAFVSGDKGGLENSIRVCLSSNKCFAKVPVDPDYPNAKNNFWRVDESCITQKMLRRHFNNSAAMFPGLLPDRNTATHVAAEPKSPVGHAGVRNQQVKPVKFNSSFSVESLLKNDQVSADSSHQSPAPEQGPRLDMATMSPNRSVCRPDQFYVRETFVRMKYLDEEYQQHNVANSADGVWPYPMMALPAEPDQALCPPHLSYQTFIRPSSCSSCTYGLTYPRW